MTLSEAIDIYVRHRHDEGSTYVNGENVLRAMCRNVGDQSLTSLTAEGILGFLNRSRISATTRRGNHSMLNRFLRHWSCREAMPILKLPEPARCSPSFVPHVYSRTQIKALLSATALTQENSAILNAATLRMFLLMLYATGAVINELLALTVRHLDLRQSQLTLPGDRRARERCIPICADLRSALRVYIDSAHKNPCGDCHIFRKLSGEPLAYGYLNESFKRLVRMTRIGRQDQVPTLPRMQDFRATFAVHQLSSWFRDEEYNVDRMLPALSTYMGYADLAATERYLCLVPERFSSDLQKLSPKVSHEPWSSDPDLMNFLNSL